MNALRSVLAVMMFGLAFHSHDSQAVLVFANGSSEIEWYVGDQVPSIDLAPPGFVVLACGAELAWVYANFPTIPMRTIGGTATTAHRAFSTATPPENTCVIWRGDNARFIADNLAVTE